MEQKTEASQAVDECAEFVKYATSSHSVIPAGLEWSHQTVRHAWEVWQASRAALKAQPAPTEAPNFCARCGKRLHAGSIHTCTPPAPTEAQGEDSARLDYEATFQSSITALVMRHIDMMNDICEEDTAVQVIESFVDRFDPLFDLYMTAKFPGRARASAETGGVKP